MITVKRKAYTRKDGTRVKATTFRITDRGKPGRTPKKNRWYEPTVKMEWHKGDSAAKRRRNALKAHKGDSTAAGRALMALANVTTDLETKHKAQADARFLFRH